MKIERINEIINHKYPYKLQEEWDSSGILTTNNLHQEITGIIICLDITNDVVEKALKTNSNLIISHHPIFIKSDNFCKMSSDIKTLERIKRNEISIISCHTNFDKSNDGMNYHIAKSLNFNQINKIKNNDLMVVGKYHYERSIADLVANIRRTFNLEDICIEKKYLCKKIRKLGIIGGTGFSEIKNYLLNNQNTIDAFLTSDLKWHNWMECNQNNICIINVSHSIENIFVDIMANFIQRKTKIKPIKMKSKIDLIFFNK